MTHKHAESGMGEAKHTAGPWTIVEYGDGDSLAIHDGDSANRICFMATHGGSQKQWETIQANAALISAAPDQFEAGSKAAKLLRQYVHTDEPVPLEEFEKVLFQLDAAIAKATGGTL